MWLQSSSSILPCRHPLLSCYQMSPWRNSFGHTCELFGIHESLRFFRVMLEQFNHGLKSRDSFLLGEPEVPVTLGIHLVLSGMIFLILEEPLRSPLLLCQLTSSSLREVGVTMNMNT